MNARYAAVLAMVLVAIGALFVYSPAFMGGGRGAGYDEGALLSCRSKCMGVKCGSGFVPGQAEECRSGVASCLAECDSTLGPRAFSRP